MNRLIIVFMVIGFSQDKAMLFLNKKKYAKRSIFYEILEVNMFR